MVRKHSCWFYLRADIFIQVDKIFDNFWHFRVFWPHSHSYEMRLVNLEFLGAHRTFISIILDILCQQEWFVGQPGHLGLWHLSQTPIRTRFGLCFLRGKLWRYWQKKMTHSHRLWCQRINCTLERNSDSLRLSKPAKKNALSVLLCFQSRVKKIFYLKACCSTLSIKLWSSLRMLRSGKAEKTSVRTSWIWLCDRSRTTVPSGISRIGM